MALITGVQYSGTPAGTILPCGHGIAISSISAASPAVVSTGTTAHGLLTGDSVFISGTSTTPSTIGVYTVTVISTTTFSIPVAVTVAGGAAGFVSKIPARMLLCDGTSYPTATYPTLFAVIGYTYGGSGLNFNVPDARGIFLRGVGSQTIGAITYSGTVGAKQNDAYPSHNHGGGGHTHSFNSYDSQAPTIGNNSPTNYYGNPSIPRSNTVSSSGTIITANGSGTETQPANLGVNYCIAY